MGGKSTSLTVLKYEEIKSFVKSWVLMSQTTPAKMKDDNNKILEKINLNLEEIRSIISTEPKSADDLVDVSKLTIGKASQAIEMNEFTRGQRTTILSFLRQNKGKRFK